LLPVLQVAQYHEHDFREESQAEACLGDEEQRAEGAKTNKGPGSRPLVPHAGKPQAASAVTEQAAAIAAARSATLKGDASSLRLLAVTWAASESFGRPVATRRPRPAGPLQVGKRSSCDATRMRPTRRAGLKFRACDSDAVARPRRQSTRSGS
jgi:hypothetical protein